MNPIPELGQCRVGNGMWASIDGSKGAYLSISYYKTLEGEGTRTYPNAPLSDLVRQLERLESSIIFCYACQVAIRTL